MKYYMKIVVFLFAFNMSVYLLNVLGIYQFQVSSESAWINYIFSQADKTQTYQPSFIQGVGDILTGITKFIAFTAYAMFYPRGILIYLGFPDVFAWIIQGMIIFAYIMAFVEFISGRTMR